MAIPVHLWLTDDGGTPIKGSSTVTDRENSIEVISFSHGLNLPIDRHSGQITGTRQHSSMMIEKEFDASSPYLYQAVSKGKILQAADLHWYRINSAGREEVFFKMSLKGIKIGAVNPSMANIKLAGDFSLNPTESVSLMYDSITWCYVDGNIEHTDSWDDR